MVVLPDDPVTPDHDQPAGDQPVHHGAGQPARGRRSTSGTTTVRHVDRTGRPALPRRRRPWPRRRSRARRRARRCATNSPPGSACRESTHGRPVTITSSASGAATPAATAAISASVSGIIGHRRDGRAQHGPVVERVHDPVDLLARSWPLPATTTTSPAAGQRDRALDGGSPVGHDLDGAPRDLVGAALQRRQDRQRVLRPRVVVGEHHHVGAARRDLRPSPAACAGRGRRPRRRRRATRPARPGQAARGREQPLERVRAVRVVDEGEELLALAATRSIRPGTPVQAATPARRAAASTPAATSATTASAALSTLKAPTQRRAHGDASRRRVRPG